MSAPTVSQLRSGAGTAHRRLHLSVSSLPARWSARRGTDQSGGRPDPGRAHLTSARRSSRSSGLRTGSAVWVNLSSRVATSGERGTGARTAPASRAVAQRSSASTLPGGSARRETGGGCRGPRVPSGTVKSWSVAEPRPARGAEPGGQPAAGAADDHRRPIAAGPMIVASNLRKSFPVKSGADVEAVKGIDLEVARGESFGFLGPNGAGKSSTMRMIACVSPRTGGELSILGLDPDLDGVRIRGRLGCRPAAGQPRRRTDGAGEPDRLRPLLRYLPVGMPAAGGGAAGLRAIGREGRHQGRDAVRWDEAPADHRPVADQRSGAAAARRADHRARPAGSTCVVGQIVSAQASGRDAGRHHPLHGRGRAALRPAGGDGRRQDRRARVAGRTDRGALVQGGAGAAVPARRAGRGAGAGSTDWSSGSRCCPTGCCSTPTTATSR